jgi:hypothetical protein
MIVGLGVVSTTKGSEETGPNEQVRRPASADTATLESMAGRN